MMTFKDHHQLKSAKNRKKNHSLHRFYQKFYEFYEWKVNGRACVYWYVCVCVL